MLASERLRLRKNSKLLRKVEFERLRSAPFRRAGALMAISVAQGEEKFAKCGVICSRKFSLLAVERNRARRLIWESFRLLGRRIQACSMVIIPRRRIKQASQEMVLKELSEHLAAARVLTTDPQKAPADLPPEL